MNRDEIIEMVQKLTERKSENVLEPLTLYRHVLHQFCGEARFWWRKRSFSFNTVANTPQYDLSAVATTPDVSVLSAEEIIRIHYVSTTKTITELTPVFDDLTIAELIEQFDTPGLPGIWCFDGTDYKTIRLNMPNAAYKIRVFAWMMPNPATDDPSAVVPLVPPWLHKAIVHGMEAYIWRVSYGQQDERFVTAKAAYDQTVDMAKLRPRWSVQGNLQFISPESSVQTTGRGTAF
jgi:hypothetical protein